MPGIRTDRIPQKTDGPSLVAAASGLMLLPENASRHVRLHRLAALGMALADDSVRAASPSSIRSILKRDDIGGPRILTQEDPYSEVLIQSVSFFGGTFLVSAGSGEHSVADIENLLEAVFSEPLMPDDLRRPTLQLVRGLLTISDLVLNRAGLTRGASPGGSPGTSIYVPGVARLKELTDATFISNDELDARGDWLRVVVDTFAMDPGDLVEPCTNDITDDRLDVAPFLRLADGYRVVLPLDLLITVRFHLLRFARQTGQLAELGRRLRETALRRFMRLVPSASPQKLLEQSEVMSRYLVKIDDKRDLHLILATDPLIDWSPQVWGSYDTRAALAHLQYLVSPNTRRSYSSAEDLVHLVIVDSPGRGAFWGAPDVDGADPVLIARSDDLEVIFHQEPDGMLGLLLFAQAVDKHPGYSMSTGILDEFCTYVDHGKSFYFSDSKPPTFTSFQPGGGLYPRRKFYMETDRHGVVPPTPNPHILQAIRRYKRDLPEIFAIAPTGSYFGYVVEFADQTVFITLNREESEFSNAALNLLECVAYWVRECAIRVGSRAAAATTEIVLTLSDTESWKRVVAWSTTDPAVRITPTINGASIEFTDTFAALLQNAANDAERELVKALLASFFGIAGAELAPALEAVAPMGPKRMLNAFNQNSSPDMLAENLPRSLRGHDQVTAQVLDDLGEWMRSPSGGRFAMGSLVGVHRIRALKVAVEHLFELLEKEVASYSQQTLLDFLISQNESLSYEAKFNSLMLRSRLACFGEQSDTVNELVQHRTDGIAARRANRFLIEYVAAKPPFGTRTIAVLDYYRILAIAAEIIHRATTSDFLHYGLADIEVSILASGRLGVSQEEPVTAAIQSYAAESGRRSVRHALEEDPSDDRDDFDVAKFIDRSEAAMRAEFGFTLPELREVCAGLIDLATADQVTRIHRSEAISEIASKRDTSQDIVSAVLDGITLASRSSFLEIGEDA